jgi:hypothetical protein
MCARMAAEAFLVDFLGRSLGRIEDLGDIAAAFNVSSARSMATFAIHSGCAVLSRKLGVRIAFKFLGYFFMAGRANFPANVRIWSSVFTLRNCRFSLSRSLRSLCPKRRCAQNACAHQYRQAYPQPRPFS